MAYFDARVSTYGYWGRWPDYDHLDGTRFDLSTDFERPLSADTMIWPSVFDMLHLPTSLWEQGFTLGCWTDLAGMLAYLDQERAQIWRSYWVVALTALCDLQTFEDHHFYFTDVQRSPAKVDPAWRLLGFDVAEQGQGQISGLLNLGYTPSERAEGMARFGPLLNHYHLFDEQVHATSFAQWTARRDPAHGPFCVWGIYLISEVPGASRIPANGSKE